VLSWNELYEALNTAQQTVKSSTNTVDLRRIKPQNISVIGGNRVSLSDPDRVSITSSLVAQVQYKYPGQWQSSKPLFAQLPFGSFAEATALAAPIRDIVNSCHSQ
jgi:hypothetical protein